MEIRQLRSFRSVANLLSFNKAADRLHYAQSSISAQIHGLEEELGAHLFDRSGKRVQLTEAGLKLLHYADKILDLVEETESELKDRKEPSGSLTVRIPESFGALRLPAIIAEFHARYPKVRLNFITCTHDGLEKDLRKGVTDLAFLLTESINSADMVVETLGFENVVLVAAPAHPLAAKRSVHTRDLSGETILLSKVDCSYRKSFEEMLDREEVNNGHRIEFYSVEALKRTLINGVGVSVLPEKAIAGEIHRKELVRLPWTEEKMEVALLMIRYRDKWVSPSLNAFMAVTRRIAQNESAAM